MFELVRRGHEAVGSARRLPEKLPKKRSMELETFAPGFHSLPTWKNALSRYLTEIGEIQVWDRSR